METEPVLRPRVILMIWLVASQGLAFLLLIFWVPAAEMAATLLDAGLLGWGGLLAFAVCAYPICPVVLTVAAWFAFLLKREVWAAILTTLTFLPLLVLILFILLLRFQGAIDF